jgi:hypothetical protein
MVKAEKALLEEAALGRGDWYQCQVLVPTRAMILDFVVSDLNRQV